MTGIASLPHRTTSGHDTGALILRLSLGPMLAYHGYNKVAGGDGLDGTASWFEALGLRPGRVHARLAATTEIGAGIALAAGAASPLPAAAMVGLMAVAARTDHRGKGFFVFKGGWEYTAVVGGAALASAATGPGRWSVDRLLRRERSGFRWALASAALGLAGATGLLGISYRPAQAEPDPAKPERTEFSPTEPS
jgi:putative oxidoreductase